MRRPKVPRGMAYSTVAVLLVLIAIVAFGGFFLRGAGSGALGHGQEIFEVARGGYDITIPASGDLAALNQIEIRNKLETRAVITEIVDEGTIVLPGDELVRFNDEEILDQIDDALDDVDTAENNLVNARSILSIRQETRNSELAKADLAIELAELALKEWRQGTVESKRKELALAKERAEKNYERLEERYARSVELEQHKYISTDDLKKEEIELIEAKAAREQNALEIVVYESYTYPSEKKTKESDLQQAIAERDRVEQRWDAEVRGGESDLRSAEHKLKSRNDRLEGYREQHEACVLTAPAGGLVVYYSSLEEGRWRGDGQPPQVGTEIHRNMLIMVLPDTSEMVVAVKVNEALSGLIEVGQRATVVPDAMPDVTLHGEVISVGVLAEAGGWRDPNRRDYTVRLKLDGGNDIGLKPSMRCRSDIAVGRVDNSLYVPIQAIFRQGPVAFVYRPEGSGFVPTPVMLGRASELYVEILDGLEEGQQVLLREPDPREILRPLEVPDMPQGDMMAGQHRGKGRPEAPGGQPQSTAATADNKESGQTETSAAAPQPSS